MLGVEMGLKDGEGDKSPARSTSTGAVLWAHWLCLGFGVETLVESLDLPVPCGVWGFSALGLTASGYTLGLCLLVWA